MLVLLSNSSVSKEGYVQKEIKKILDVADEKPEGTIFVIPLRLNNCKLPRRLEKWHCVDAFPESRQEWAYKRVLGSLKIRAAKLDIDLKNVITRQDKKEEWATEEEWQMLMDIYKK